MASLESLCRAQFKNLSHAELILLRSASTRLFAFCGPSELPSDSENDPANAEKWDQEREVRSDIIRWVCVDRHARELVDPDGLQLFGAKIVGRVDLADITFPFPLTFNHCAFTDELVLGAAQIPELDLQGSSLDSLYGDRMRVTGSVFMRYGFSVKGVARLLVAQIGGNLECDNSLLRSGLNADGLKVSGSVFLRLRNDREPKSCVAKGEVRLVGAQIDGNLECDGAFFQGQPSDVPNRGNVALNVSGAVVKGDVFLRNHFRSEGVVQLVGTQIGGDLNCSTSEIDVLDGRRVAVKGAIFWREIANPASVRLNLSDASSYALYDDSASWPTKGRLHVDGFVYSTTFQAEKDPKNRMEWLDRNDPFSPQPYRQLAKVLSDRGMEDESLEVLMQMQKLTLEQDWYGYPESWLLRGSIGYGYHPLRAFWELIGLAGLGWIVYRRAEIAKKITPTDVDAYTAFKRDRVAPPHYPRFSPLVYSLENSLPLVKLGQADHWQPDPSPATDGNSGEKGFLSRFRRTVHSPRFVQGFLWLQILLGWVLATLFAAGVTGIIRK
jgi:hypothetical protein